MFVVVFVTQELVPEMLLSEEHLANIPSVLVTLLIFHKPSDEISESEEQPQNVRVMSVTALVFHEASGARSSIEEQ